MPMMHDSDKIEHMMTGIRASNAYGLFLELHAINQVDVVDMKYDDFIEQLLSTKPNPASYSIAGNPYATAAAAAASSSDLVAQLLNTVTNLTQKVDALANLQHRPSAAAATTVTKTRVKFPPHYCWSHGYCFHTSAGCTNRDPGHEESATATDRKGGSKRNLDKWSEGQKKN